MSIPDNYVKQIEEKSERIFEQKVKENKILLEESEHKLASEEEKQYSIEEKWITNQISKEVYDSWTTTIQTNKTNLKALINELTGDGVETYELVQSNLHILTDLKYVYTKSSTVEKQELVRLGFDNNLYYQEGIYRTPVMIEMLAHNELIMKEKSLVI